MLRSRSCRNRTIVGLKPPLAVSALVGVTGSQSHHSGIETSMSIMLLQRAGTSRNRTIVGLKPQNEIVCAKCIQKSRNRTIVGLKQLAVEVKNLLPAK